MALQAAQQDAVIAHLKASADYAEAFVNAKTNGFWHGLISGDTGGGERTFVTVVKERTIPALERTRVPAQSDDAAAARWRALANSAEEDLAKIDGYAAEGTVDQILGNTVAKTAEDVKEKIVIPAAFGGGLGLVLAAVVFALLYLPRPARAA